MDLTFPIKDRDWQNELWKIIQLYAKYKDTLDLLKTQIGWTWKNG